MIHTIKSRKLLPMTILHTNGNTLSNSIRLQKYVFLLDKEKLSDIFKHGYKYKKYDYGPYSTTLNKDMEEMDTNGIVTVQTAHTAGGNIRYTYTLTNKGENLLTNIINTNHDVDTIYNKADALTTKYSTESLRNLLNYIYKNYPYYIENSVYIK